MSKVYNPIMLRNYVLFLVIIWLATITFPTSAVDARRGRAVGTEPIDALLTEDNSDAFIAWRRANVKHRTIVHIDSHIDLEWVPDADLKRIFDAKMVEELNQLQLNPFHPEERASKPFTIMNYLYPAMREGMVQELYWVVPDSLMEGKSVFDRFKYHLIETLAKLSIDDLNSFRMQKGAIQGRVYGIPLTICKLSDLPRFQEPVVLDIDADYFDPPDGGKRIDIPTIWPQEFINALMEKGMRSDLVSICYSVRGGYLALEYRFLGDELADILKDPKGNNSIGVRMRGHRRLAFVYRAKGMYREAIDEFDKALALDPDIASLHYGLGLLYNQLGKPNKASKEFSRSATIDSIYKNPFLYDADYYLDKKMYGEALPLYERILKQNPTYLKGIFGAGLCCSKLGKWDEAEGYFRRFVEIHPNFYLVHFNLGVIHSELERWERAEEEYRRTLELHPHFGKAYQNLGILYALRGEIDKAIWAFEKAVENNPCFKSSHNNLGGIYARLGKYDEAIKAFRKAVRIDPQYATGYRNLGKVYFALGNLSDALELAQKAVELRPTAQSFHLLAWIYFKRGMYEEAEETINRALELAPGDESLIRSREKIRGKMRSP